MNQKEIYAELNDVLNEYQMGITASELHGMLTGFYVSGNYDKAACFELIADFANDGNAFPDAIITSLEKLYHFTDQQFSSPFFEFSLLISNDEPFQTQINDVTDWISQFLFGFGVSKQKLTDVSNDVKEVINDLNQLALLSYDDEYDLTENEKMLDEVIEYVRIAVMLCYEEFVNSKKQADVLH